MQASADLHVSRPAIRFKSDAARAVATRHKVGATPAAQAAFFGVTENAYWRVLTGRTRPGETFMARVLSSRPGPRPWPFEKLFEVVGASQ